LSPCYSTLIQRCVVESLFRRPSGIYVLRLAVPAPLRAIIGKREIVATTGTRELTIAKMVAGTLAAQWRQRFFDSGRLLGLAAASSMDHHEILKVAHGHPMLLGGGHLPLSHAAGAAGLGATDLLRAAAQGHLDLYMRPGRIRGHLVRANDLEPVDPVHGAASGLVVPSASHMPANAAEHINEGMLRISGDDLDGVTAALLAGADGVDLVLLEVPERPGIVFAPDTPVRVVRDALEVAAFEVEAVRKMIASKIEPDRLKEAIALRRAELKGDPARSGQKGHERLSVALKAYVTNRVRRAVGLDSEIKRIENGCSLLVELEGDVPLADIDSDRLRQFRDEKLARVPAHENKIRLMHGTRTVAESMKAVVGTDWPVMSVLERDKRMRWIGAWFRWLQEQKWITDDPASGLHGESVLTKAERRKLKSSKRDDEARDPFNEADLRAIFSALWFKTGRGELTKEGTFRTFTPFYYWLPLLGLFTGGGRINELCQLHLGDIRQTESGAWFVDINDESDDKHLKTTPSKRKVPLHPTLLALGFDKWHAALDQAGYTRLFPELKLDREKGYGKAATKWFTNYMASLDIPRDGRKTFHSFRHTYTNALPDDTPERIRKQLTGHTRGSDSHDKTYRKDVQPEIAAPYVNRLTVTLPDITAFDVEAGLNAIKDALKRKNRGRGAEEDLGGE